MRPGGQYLWQLGKQKRAIMGPFRAGLRGGNGAKHLNLDNSPAKQLAPAPLANSARLDICSRFCQCPLHKVDASSQGGAWLESERGLGASVELMILSAFAAA